MAASLDHFVLGARDHAAAAKRLAEVLNGQFAGYDGIDGKFAVVALDREQTVLFVATETVDPQHVAFRVDVADVSRAVEVLIRHGVDYGDSPFDPANGRIGHPIAQAGVFWRDSDGHLFELLANNGARGS